MVGRSILVLAAIKLSCTPRVASGRAAGIRCNVCLSRERVSFRRTVLGCRRIVSHRWRWRHGALVSVPARPIVGRDAADLGQS
jgi:hypothetical protein